MPIILKRYFLLDTKLYIWKIVEPETFFHLHDTLSFNTIKHPKVRLQKKVGRFLLKTMNNNFSLKNIDFLKSKKPYYKNNKFFFSISHSKNYVGAILSSKRNVGIDIQHISSKATVISQKILSKKEYIFYKEYIDKKFLASLLWSLKECFYKYLDQTEISFKTIDIHISNKAIKEKKTTIFYLQKTYLIEWDILENTYIVSWLISPF